MMQRNLGDPLNGAVVTPRTILSIDYHSYLYTPCGIESNVTGSIWCTFWESERASDRLQDEERAFLRRSRIKPEMC